MLHNKKSQSILQWFNSMTTKGDVNSMSQFTDGSHFYEIIASMNHEINLATESIIFSETSIACNEEVVTSAEEGLAEGKVETSVSESEDANPFVVKESEDADSEQKYSVIRKFIDDFYHLESSSLIDYKECQNGKEFELAKVAVFLLSAMVQSFVSFKQGLVFNAALLEPEIQENIYECLSYVLEKDKEENQDKEKGENRIKKSELHKILSHPANYKGVTPTRRQPSRSISEQIDSSEGVKSVSKKRKERTSIYEDVQYSPLKTYLESPKDQYNAALFRKESELAKLRGALHLEENKVMDLTAEKVNLNAELERKNKELEFYKKELKSQREVYCEKEDLTTEELENKKIEKERVKKLIETHEEEIKQLKEDNEALQEKISDLEVKLEKKESIPNRDENNILMDKIVLLEVDCDKKSETIKTLSDKVVSLENDLKMYQQMYTDFSSANSRRELRSPNVPETLSTIIYVDEKSQETPERKEQVLRDTESKDERIKRLALQQQKEDILKIRNMESLQKSMDVLEREKSKLKEKLDYYEKKFGQITDDTLVTRDLNFIKVERGRLRSASDEVSEISSTSGCKYDNKMEGQLWANVSDDSPPTKKEIDLQEGKIQYQRKQLLTIITQLERKHCVPASPIRKLRENCSRIKTCEDVSAGLRDLGIVVKLPVETPVTTRRSRSLAKQEEDALILMNKNRNLEQENRIYEQNFRSCQIQIERELRVIIKELETSVTKLKNENEALRQEITIVNEKYKNVKQLAQKKAEDIKKTLHMFQIYRDKCVNLESKQCSRKCEEVRRLAKELRTECSDFEKETALLKSAKKTLEGQLENLRHHVKQLTKENKELQHKLWIETSALSSNISDRDAVVHHYLSKSKHEFPKTANHLQLRSREDQWNSSRSTMKFDRFLRSTDQEQSLSNSILASSSVRSGFFETADEDDFLNESSLAEIRNGSIPEGESGDSRLQEIQRRNTLCQPHLRSCYPLEIQNMTPSQKKYFDIEENSFNLGSKNDFKKPKSRYNDDSEESGDYSSVKKRKLTETDHSPPPVEKKQCRPTAKIIGPKKKPSTPLKRVANFVRRQSTFRTPVSVQRLMSLPRKSHAE